MAAEIRRHALFLVLGHLDPDGDCISSQLLLSSILNRMGKRALLLNEGPFTRPEIAAHAPAFLARLPPSAGIEGAAAIYVDCSTPDRVGKLASDLGSRRSIVVDHHASGTVFGDVRWIEPTRPSVTVMLLDLMDRLEIEPSAEEARLVLFGLCTDTAFFRHLGAGASAVFTTAARLVDLGASPAETFLSIYGNRGLEERRRLGQTLARTESHAGGRIVLCTQTVDERSGGSEEIYRLLQTVAGVRLVVLIREESAATYSVSLRSLGDIDVGEVARSLGGGGHAPAAGCTQHGTLDEVRARMLKLLEPLVGQ